MTRNLRVGQAITVFGPGAIIDIGDESFVNCTIDHWADPRTNQTHHAYSICRLDRLSTKLGVRQLWQPSVEDRGFGRGTPWSICTHRFPSWMFCQSCRRMHQWSWQEEGLLKSGQIPACKHCSPQKRRPLVPMRWVQVCDRGHLDDIDWNWEVHRVSEGCTNKDAGSLVFKSRAKGGSGLDGLEVRCSRCNAAQTIRQIIARVNGRVCHGGQPWMRRSERIQCDGRWKVSQRGDSNVHFSVVASALDIPEGSGSQGATTVHNLDDLRRFFAQIATVDPALIRQTPIFKDAVAAMGGDADSLFERLSAGEAEPGVVTASAGSGFDADAIKSAEYPVLKSPVTADTIEFSGRSYRPDRSDFGTEVATLIDSISLLDRLREVRAFRGFHRLKPGDSDRMIAAGAARDWLPAYEVFGEGIFIDFDPTAIHAWQARLPGEAGQRLKGLLTRIAAAGLSYLPKPNLPFLAVHAFSHGLMRQLSFDCGYAASSLRERLYQVGNRLGLLIYTAAGDSEGTLGGLVRMGESCQLGDVIARTLREMAWCSGDPICLESIGQGISGLNEASCHACMLVSETSCECGNALLNRRLAVGDTHLEGLFSRALEELENKS